MSAEESKKENFQFQENPNKSNKKTIIVVFIILVILAVGAKLYLDFREKNETLQANLDATYAQLDSISGELDAKIQEIQKLGGDITELELIRNTLEDEKQSLKESNNWAANQIRRYKDKVSGYEELLTLQDEKIKKLENVNKALMSENTTLKEDKNQLNDSISSLRTTRQKLESKVEIASRLKAENIRIFAVNKRGKEREDEFKPRHIDHLKVTFNLAENNVAQPEGKDIYLRVMDPKGKILFDVANGSGSFMIDGKELFYTATQEILFDNTKQKLSFIYNRGKEYEEGVFKIELYADDYEIGRSEFVVK
jgi:predicted nuclease with TOPRIM domain